MQRKVNFLQWKHSSVEKKHSTEEIYNKETVLLALLGKSLSEIVSLHQLRHIHQLVQNLFPNVKVSNFPLAGRLQYFGKHWKKLTCNPKILEWVSKNRLHFGTISEKSSTSSKNVSTGILVSDKGGGNYVEEGNHPKNICEKRSIL